MTATPPPSTNEDSASSERARRADVWSTWLLLGGLFVLLLVLALASSFGIRDCADMNGVCDETQVAISAALAPPGLWVIFGISLVVSVVLLNRRKRAFFVPLIGAGAMITCIAIASILRP